MAFGNTFDAVAVARWERAYDPEVAEPVLSKSEDQDDALLEISR